MKTFLGEAKTSASHLTLFVLIFVLGLFFGACGEDAKTEPNRISLTATDGDGIPEMNGAPTFSLSSVAIDNLIDVHVTVDTDTTNVAVYIGTWNNVEKVFTLYGFSGNNAVTPGSTTPISVIPSSALSAIPGIYQAMVITCAATSCTPPNVGRWYIPGATYSIADLVDNSLVGITNVVPNTFTVIP